MSSNCNVGAAAPGPVTPTSDNAPWQGRVEGSKEADSRDFASEDANGKELATMVASWNWSEAVPCLRAVGDMLRQMGVQR